MVSPSCLCHVQQKQLARNFKQKKSMAELKQGLRKLQKHFFATPTIWPTNLPTSVTNLLQTQNGNFFLKLSNCKVMNYEQDLFRCPKETDLLHLNELPVADLVSKHVYEDNSTLYYMTGEQLRQLLYHLQQQHLQDLQAFELLRRLFMVVLPSSIAENCTLQQFLQHQKQFF